MTECSKNQLNCLNEVLDCQRNDISIDNQCYNVQKTTGSINDPNKIKFNVTRREKLNTDGENPPF